MAMRRDVEKVVAAQFLESTKEVLDHLSRWKISLNERSEEAPEGLASTYGKVRRLRDYLQRCVAAYPNPVSLDLSEEDENLLVSCAVHALGVVELELRDSDEDDRGQRPWLEEKRRNLSQWAVKIANRPVERIPSPEAMRLNTETVRSVVAMILRSTNDASAPVGSKTPFFGAGPGKAAVEPPQALAPQPPSGSLLGGGGSSGGGLEPRPVAPSSPARGLPAAFGGAGGRLPGDPPAPAAQANASAPSLLDARRVRDPRLRSMLAMDLRALERAQEAHDHRLAMVHLSSILEAAVMDYALPRYKQLGIKGPPETWKVEDIVLVAMGDRLGSMDRAYLFQVVAGRNLVRPGIQLHAPMVVTSSSLDQSLEFVKRVLVDMGYAGSMTVAVATDRGQGAAKPTGLPPLPNLAPRVGPTPSPPTPGRAPDRPRLPWS
ncbi:MAG: hypothetical protein AAF628_04690 [Planctomycetota bacterium]